MLRLINRNRGAVGLDIGSSIIKAVQLRPSRKHGFELISLGFTELSPDSTAAGSIGSQLRVSDAIRRLFSEQGIQGRLISTSIAGNSVIVKRVSLPILCEKSLAESIRWQAEPYIPFDIDDVNLDYQILNQNVETETLDILLVAGKKDKINEYTNVIEMAGKTPVLVDVDAFAIQNAYVINYKPANRDIAVLLDIGAANTTITLVSGTDFLFTRGVGMGGNQYTELIQKTFNLGRSEAEALKQGASVENIDPADAQPAIHSVTEILCLEIQKTYDFLKSTITADPVDRMLVSGGSARIPGLTKTLALKFEVPVELFNSFRKIAINPKQFSSSVIADRAPDFAVATGLALRCVK